MKWCGITGPDKNGVRFVLVQDKLYGMGEGWDVTG